MKKRQELPLHVKPLKTYQLVSGFIDSLDSLEDIRFEELLSIPKTSGTYSSIEPNEQGPKAIGYASCLYVGYRPVFKENNPHPYAFDICFHTQNKGVVPILRIISLDTLDPELVDEINDLKLKANQAIAQRLSAADINDVLIRYQWYSSLLYNLDIPIGPSDTKKTPGAIIDYASDQAGVNVGSKSGLWADNSSVAIKIMDHLGFTFKAPRKMAPQYPLDLNAYLVTLLKDGARSRIIVSHDLEPYMTGSTAQIVPEINGAVSYFRPVFTKSAHEAGELFAQMIGLSGQTEIETDEDPIDYEANTTLADQVIVETPPTTARGAATTMVSPVRENPPQQSFDAPGENEKLDLIRKYGFDVIDERGNKVLIRKIANIPNLDIALEIIEEELDFIEEEPENFYPQPPMPSHFQGSRQPLIPQYPARNSKPNPFVWGSKKTHAFEQREEEDTNPTIYIDRSPQNGSFQATIGNEILLSGSSLEDIKNQLRLAREQDVELNDLEIRYRTASGKVEPISLDPSRRNPQPVRSPQAMPDRRPQNRRRWRPSF